MINSLEDLQMLLKLCRKQGVTKIDLGYVKLEFGELPQKSVKVDQDDKSEQGEMTPYELLNWNTNGVLDADLQS